MVQQQSWEGSLTDWYEKNLNLRGGYARKRFRDKPSSIANSEYVKSDDIALTIVAQSGKKINPIRDIKRNITPHYHNPYGNEVSARKFWERFIKSPYGKRVRILRQMRR